MYHTVFLDERVALTPSELNTVVTKNSIVETLTEKLRKKHEGRCNANGYVKPDSLSIIGRSMGIAENGRFTGNVLYDCKFKCDVMYPVGGAEMDATVIKVNKMGAYTHVDQAIRILLPRDLHVGNVSFDAIEEGRVVRVRVERSRFQVNDPYIMAVGILVDRDEAKPVSRRGKRGAASAKSPKAPSVEEEALPEVGEDAPEGGEEAAGEE
jgi:DNA-directed RNA polymerase subunit E'/Rpb7